MNYDYREDVCDDYDPPDAPHSYIIRGSRDSLGVPQEPDEVIECDCAECLAWGQTPAEHPACDPADPADDIQF